MKLLFTGLKFAAALAALAALSLVLAPADQKAQAHDVTTAQAANQPDVVYSYVAQSGDSYTKMARKAVQTYGLTEKINLTPAGIIYAETNLTLQAGSPVLSLGQKVEIKEDVVHDWVDKASKLTDSQQAAWNRYVPFVNFDTSKVGESS